ncbi:MAG: 4-hydroxybenzoate octaprenyltransferase, partial [Pirellulales bacterium]|nr:4-hydroxybenzoate octaprenyltransferase [Pirellulales bacterium]
MFKTVGHLLSLIRFSHTIFALPFAMLAAMMAWRLRAIESGEYSGFSDFTLGIGPWNFSFNWSFEDKFQIRWPEIVGILLCMVTARSAAMAFNRLADRRIDAENPRTEKRHLPAGILSVTQVTAFTVACGFAFIASTLLFLPNRLPLYLSIPVLLFLCGYSYAKRFTSLAHVWLGAALALSPIAAWIAIRGEVVLQHPGNLLPALVLGGAVLTWVTGFDIIYA